MGDLERDLSGQRVLMGDVDLAHAPLTQNLHHLEVGLAAFGRARDLLRSPQVDGDARQHADLVGHRDRSRARPRVRRLRLGGQGRLSQRIRPDRGIERHAHRPRLLEACRQLVVVHPRSPSSLDPTA